MNFIIQQNFQKTNSNNMLTLLSECHFWTTREDVRIKHTDFGAFRYTRNREWQHMPVDRYAVAKRDYTERRNGLTVLKNSRKSRMGRLKENLKRLEELMRTSKVIHIHWTDGSQVLLLFANGIIAHICIDMFTGDISRMVYEKYLVGKLAADTITDAFFTRSHIVLAYNTNQVTVVHLQKPNSRSQGPEKISHMEPKIFHAIIPGAAERRLARRLSVNPAFDMFVIWTKSSQNEVFPWRPTMRDQDRANIHVFKLKGNQLDFFAYCWSENDPLHVDFLRTTENQILTLEQKISRKGEITAEVCSYEIIVGKMQRSPLSSIPMGTQITTYAFSPDQEKLFLGSVDRYICLHDLVMQTTKSVTQIDIVPTECSWHSDSSMIMIANTRSQFECFDLALTPIGNQLQSEDVTPTNLLDLSHYFASQPTLLQVSFSRKPEIGHSSNNYAGTDCFLLLLYDQGPIGCLRFFAGAGMRGDIHNSGLTADVILDKYLALNQLEKAVNLLNSLNWETYGAMCLISLHKIANHIFYKGDPRRARIDLMARALKTFTDSLSEETKDEFSDQVFDLKRRFFFFLLRRNLFSEAFEVAQDIEDYDLFMDLFNITKFDPNLAEFSAACFSQAAAILHEEDQGNGDLITTSEFRSESACSQSTISENANRAMQRTYQQPPTPIVPTNSSYQPKFFQHPLVSGNIPSTSTNTSLAPYSISNEEYQKILLSKKPTASILSNGSSAQNGSNTSVLSGTSGQNGNIKDGSKHTNGEKNKVKFSDTVQVAVVPEIPRKEKLLIKRNGYSRPPPRNFTNPKKELQDSLPLCHPNDDYLKDFNPLPSAEPSQRTENRINKKEEHHEIINKTNTTTITNSSTPNTTTTQPSIKVVNFGVV
ncbi:WD repeat-containing and planar cell polarity effector protein fritz isoform 3-T3 [Cochliomyia hominivorax]